VFRTHSDPDCVERELRNDSWSFAALASISARVRQTLVVILVPACLSLRQTISSDLLAAEAPADISTTGASGSWITPPGGAEGRSDATGATSADGSVTVGAGASGAEDAQAPMHNEIAASENRLIIVSPYSVSNHIVGSMLCKDLLTRTDTLEYRQRPTEIIPLYLFDSWGPVFAPNATAFSGRFCRTLKVGSGCP